MLVKVRDVIKLIEKDGWYLVRTVFPSGTKGIGAGIGLATGLAMRPVFPSDPVVLPVTLMFSALGTGIGALLGVLVRKRAVIYEVP